MRQDAVSGRHGAGRRGCVERGALDQPRMPMGCSGHRLASALGRWEIRSNQALSLPRLGSIDHTAALAEIKEITGAEMWATVGDARVLEDGGFSDPHFGGRESFRPVSVDKIIADGDLIEVGETRLMVLETPGHTEGSSSYTMRVREDGRDYAVAIANMGTINPGKKLVVDPTYPGVAEDFAETFRMQKALDVDIWVSAHGSQYDLHDKYVAGQQYSPDTFVDPDGFLAAVERLEKLYLEQVASERR